MDTNYTTKSQEAISGAVQAAAAAGNPQVEALHLLGELLSQEGGVAVGLLNALSPQTLKNVGAATRTALTSLPSSAGSSVVEPNPSRGFLAALEKADKLAKELTDEYISTEHILIAIAEGEDAAARACVTPAPPPKPYAKSCPPCVADSA